MLILLSVGEIAISAPKQGIPLPIPGIDDGYLSPNLVEIRIYAGIATVVSGIAVFIGTHFLKEFTRRLDKVDTKNEEILAMLWGLKEKTSHLTTTEDVRRIVSEYELRK